MSGASMATLARPLDDISVTLVSVAIGEPYAFLYVYSKHIFI